MAVFAWKKNFEIRSAKLGWGFEKCFGKFVVDKAPLASMILRHPLQNIICKNKLKISIKLHFFPFVSGATYKLN